MTWPELTKAAAAGKAVQALTARLAAINWQPPQDWRGGPAAWAILSAKPTLRGFSVLWNCTVEGHLMETRWQHCFTDPADLPQPCQCGAIYLGLLCPVCHPRPTDAELAAAAAGEEAA